MTKGIDIGYMFGVPYKAREGAMIIDVDREVTTAKSLTGDNDRKRGFVLSRGMIMSSLEHSVFEYIYGSDAVSTVKIMQTAMSADIPIITMDASNVDAMLPHLQSGMGINQDIKDLVNAGHVVTTPVAPVQIGTWSGTGYIAVNHLTDSGAYVIDGGAAGGNADIDLNKIKNSSTFDKFAELAHFRYPLKNNSCYGVTKEWYVAMYCWSDYNQMVRSVVLCFEMIYLSVFYGGALGAAWTAYPPVVGLIGVATWQGVPMIVSYWEQGVAALEAKYAECQALEEYSKVKCDR